MEPTQTESSVGHPQKKGQRLGQIEQFAYDDKIVRWFVLATLPWGFVGML
ncbi:unnamed protein product, partial [Laminaria digitata]